MSILQISKIQVRAGNLVDLPQLDDAEFGWASDAKRLFIGKSTPNENVEVLTSYSQISFSQIDGSIGNLSINPLTIDEGQILAFNGTNWVNSGGSAGGLITLGDVGNVKINGGASGYVLQTDGTGNLSWTPQTGGGGGIGIPGGADSQIQFNKAGVFGGNAGFTYNLITNTMTVGNANIANVNSSGIVAASRLVSTVTGNIPPILVYSNARVANLNVDYANVSDNGVVTSRASGVFYPTFVSSASNGNYALGSNSNLSFNASTGVLSATGVSSNTLSATTLNVSGNAAINGNATVSGNATVNGNLSATQITSTVTSGTAPFVVQSNTVVANLNVERATSASMTGVTSQSTGTYYPVFATDSSSGTYSLGANSNLAFNAANGLLSTSNLTVSGNTKTGNISVDNIANVTANLNVQGNVNVTANANITNNLNVVGSANATLVNANNLNVLNAANISGNLLVSGNELVSGTLSVTGNVVLSGTNVNLGPVSNIKIAGGGNGFVIMTDGNGNLSFVNSTTLGAQLAGGNTQIQFNDGTNLGASPAFTFTKTNNTLFLNGNATITGSASLGTVSVSGSGNVNGSLTVGGNITTGNQTVLGTLAVGGNETVGGNLSVTGSIAVSQNIQLTGSETIGGGLTVAGNSILANLSATGNISFTGANVSLGSISNVRIAGGSSGFVITTDGQGRLSYVNPTTIGTQVAGSATQVQFNDGGILGGSPGFTFNKNNSSLAVAGTISAGQASFNSLSATSATTGPLTVNGAATFNNSLGIGGTLDVNNTANLRGGLNVSVGAVFNTAGAPSVDAGTPNNGTTGGIRVRGNASTGQSIIQFTDSSGGTQWGYLSVGSDGSILYNNNRVLTVADFAPNLAANGYVRLPGGLLMQWGQYRLTTNQTSFIYDMPYNIAFSGQAYSVTMMRYDPTNSTYNQKHYVMYNKGDGTKFQWRIQDDDSGSAGSFVYGFDWIAIGPA